MLMSFQLLPKYRKCAIWNVCSHRVNVSSRLIDIYLFIYFLFFICSFIHSFKEEVLKWSPQNSEYTFSGEKPRTGCHAFTRIHPECTMHNSPECTTAFKYGHHGWWLPTHRLHSNNPSYFFSSTLFLNLDWKYHDVNERCEGAFIRT